MSNLGYLERLLDGAAVEWVPLGEITLPTSNIRWREIDDSRRYIDLTSVDVTTKKITETKEVSSDDAPSRAQKIVMKDDLIFATTRPTQLRYCLIGDEYSGEIASTGYCVLRANKSTALPKWIMHWLGTPEFKDFVEANQSGAAYPAISDGKVKEFLIPIPCPGDPQQSLAIQGEIVRILDAFTALTAELTARKTQYNHYRNQLLSFEDGEVEWKTLGEIATLRRGRVMSKEYLRDNAGEHPVYSSQTANFGMIGSIGTFDFDGEYVSWTTDGANAGTVFYRNGKFSITNVCGILKGNGSIPLNLKFLFHWLSIEAQKHVYSGMGNPKLMSHQVEKIPVPIPFINDPERSLAEQARIATILDKFDMFLTGFDAPLLNTLFVDKNLRFHGLIQAFSRTNRIFDATKTFGNIVAFRDIEQATIDAITLFGDKNTRNVVLEKSYNEYLTGFQDQATGIRLGHLDEAERRAYRIADNKLAVVTIALFLLNLRRAGERAGRLAERLSTSEKTHEIQRQMLDAASRRPADRDALAQRMHDGRF